MKKAISIILVFLPTHLFSQLWDSVPATIKGYTNYFTLIDSTLWISGIDTINGMDVYNLCTYNGTQWDSVGGGLDGQANSIIKFNNEMYIGGAFLNAGGPYIPTQYIKHITRWDGTLFNDIASITSNGGIVNSLCIYNGELYAGGKFQQIGGQNIKFLAKYNGGTSWSNVGGGIVGTFGEVNCMEIYNGELYVAGWFSSAGGISVNNIAKWDGSSWSQVGDGFSYRVLSLFADTVSNFLFATGVFEYSGSTYVRYIAKWDGVTWSGVGNGLSGPGRDIERYKNNIYIGTNDPDSSLTYWDGLNLQYITPAPYGSVTTLQVFQNELYVGGDFTSIGTNTYPYIARYLDTTTTTTGIHETNFISKLIVSPNPFTNQITVNSPDNEGNIEIRNLLGEIVFQTKLFNQQTKIDLTHLSQGMYFLSVKTKEKVFCKKIVKE